MDNNTRKQILDEMFKMWYWNGIIIAWFLSTFVFIIMGLSNHAYAATWAATIWAVALLIIRVGILVRWRRHIHDR